MKNKITLLFFLTLSIYANAQKKIDHDKNKKKASSIEEPFYEAKKDANSLVQQSSTNLNDPKNIETTGNYKNGKPYSGVFTKPIGQGKFQITTYKKGKKNGLEAVFAFENGKKKYYYKSQYDKSEKKVEYPLYYVDSTLVGFYKKGKPYAGTFIRHLDEDKIQMSTYEKGNKNGLEAVFSTKNLNKDSKNKDTYSLNDVDSTVSGFYKNGKPYDGVFLSFDENTKLKIHKTYKEGVQEGIESYYFNNITKELAYKKGKIFSGEQIEIVDNNIFIHTFKNGKKMSSTIKKIDSSKPPYNIVYNKKGFEVTLNAQSKIQAIVVYDTELHQTGKISYKDIKTKKNLGNILFNKSELTAGKVEVAEDKSNIKIYVQGKALKGLLNEEKRNLYYTFSRTSKLARPISYKEASHIMMLMIFQYPLVIKTYSVKTNELISTATKYGEKNYEGCFAVDVSMNNKPEYRVICTKEKISKKKICKTIEEVKSFIKKQ